MTNENTVAELRECSGSMAEKVKLYVFKHRSEFKNTAEVMLFVLWESYRSVDTTGQSDSYAGTLVLTYEDNSVLFVDTDGYVYLEFEQEIERWGISTQ